MYRTACQRGFLTVFFSVGSKPLEIWEVHVQNGHIARLLDPDIKSMVLDIRGTNVSTSYILCPSNNRVLGITMPFMIMVVKNLKKYFTFEVTIKDDTGSRRRFRVSNFQSTTQILPMSTVMPIGLADGWNQIHFNLSEFTRRAYNKAFVEVQKIKINANIRLRRIYFAEKLTAEEDLPPEYRIFRPMPTKPIKTKDASHGGRSKIDIIKTASHATVSSQSKLKTASMTSIVELPPSVSPPQASPLEGQEALTTDEPGPDQGAPGAGESTEAEQPESAVGTGEETPGVGDATAEMERLSPDEALPMPETTPTQDEEVASLKPISEEAEQQEGVTPSEAAPGEAN